MVDKKNKAIIMDKLKEYSVIILIVFIAFMFYNNHNLKSQIDKDAEIKELKAKVKVIENEMVTESELDTIKAEFISIIDDRLHSRNRELIDELENIEKLIKNSK